MFYTEMVSPSPQSSPIKGEETLEDKILRWSLPRLDGAQDDTSASQGLATTKNEKKIKLKNIGLNKLNSYNV